MKEVHSITDLLDCGYEAWFWFGLNRKDALTIKKWLCDHEFLIDYKLLNRQRRIKAKAMEKTEEKLSKFTRHENK